MSLAFTLIFTVAVLAGAVYAHLRLPFHTKNTRHALVARLLLVGVGAAFGAVMAATAPEAPGWRWAVAFLNGFGLVHVPAAAILFLKRQRAKG